MKRLSIVLVAGMLAFTGLGSRFDRDARCKKLAAGIVQQMLENSPILPEDVERIEIFDELGCSDVFLEVERQRIIREGV